MGQFPWLIKTGIEEFEIGVENSFGKPTLRDDTGTGVNGDFQNFDGAGGKSLQAIWLVKG